MSAPETAQHRATENFASTRHEAVLDVAARHLNARGVLQTSLAEIAAQLGVSRKALYYYVNDRQDLLFQCAQRAAQLSDARLTDALAASTRSDDALRSFLSRMLDPAQPEVAVRHELALLNETQRRAIIDRYEALVARIARLLDAGRREGVFRPCDPDINARIVVSVVSWAPLARRWIQAGEQFERSRVTDATLATLLEGLAPRAVPVSFTPLDLSALSPRAVHAFDRSGALEAKREALLRVASRLFNGKGVDATSLDEIAAHVGATKRTVHHHLGSKEALVMACYERSYRFFQCVAERMAAYAGSRLEALAAALHAAAIVYLSEELAPLSPLVGFSTLTRENQSVMNRLGFRLTYDYRALLRDGLAEGSIHDIDVEARGLMLAGITSWLIRDDAPQDNARKEQVAREVAALVAVGLRNTTTASR
jgi:AcrR family transcriptional regulator